MKSNNWMELLDQTVSYDFPPAKPSYQRQTAEAEAHDKLRAEIMDKPKKDRAAGPRSPPS
jgi:hypothetical protein